MSVTANARNVTLPHEIRETTMPPRTTPERLQHRARKLGSSTVLLICAAILLAVSACSATSVVTPSSKAVMAMRLATGGMCATGLCRDQFTIFSDSTWTHVSDSGATTAARLSEYQQRDLSMAISVTHLGEGKKFTEVCPKDYDGQEVEYLWVAAGKELSVASCDRVIDPTDPLVVFLDMFDPQR